MTDKPRYRVPAGRAAVLPAETALALRRPTAGYLRDTRSGIINTRPAVLRDHRDEVRRVWQRSAGLAMDMLMNSVGCAARPTRSSPTRSDRNSG